MKRSSSDAASPAEQPPKRPKAAAAQVKKLTEKQTTATRDILMKLQSTRDPAKREKLQKMLQTIQASKPTKPTKPSKPEQVEPQAPAMTPTEAKQEEANMYYAELEEEKLYAELKQDAESAEAKTMSRNVLLKVYQIAGAKPKKTGHFSSKEAQRRRNDKAKEQRQAAQQSKLTEPEQVCVCGYRGRGRGYTLHRKACKR